MCTAKREGFYGTPSAQILMCTATKSYVYIRSSHPYLLHWYLQNPSGIIITSGLISKLYFYILTYYQPLPTLFLRHKKNASLGQENNSVIKRVFFSETFYSAKNLELRLCVEGKVAKNFAPGF